MRLLVTGGAGFIGSNFIRYVLNRHPGYTVINLDALTYAGNWENLRDLEGSSRYHFVHGRVEDRELVEPLVAEADALVHFAANSHVDRSIEDPTPFLTTNAVGTQVLLEVARRRHLPLFLHISTDEVYGALGPEGRFSEESPLRPRSPYAASKAAADHLAFAYHVTYGLPVVIARPSNTYGSYQYPEKAIPLFITNSLMDQPLPLYGRGAQVREWLYVEDACRAFDLLLHHGRPGEAYNISTGEERSNLEVARSILQGLGKSETLIRFVPDRPGHDFRYAMDASKIKREVGWEPLVPFEEGLRRTIAWYREHSAGWLPVKERLARESRGYWS